MSNSSKTRASKQKYNSQIQLEIVGFESPFKNKLDPNNRWVHLSNKIPWDKLVNLYIKKLNNGTTGASSINPRVVIGAIMIKHLNNYSDRETILNIQENMYLQYFIGYSAFSLEAPFDASLFVELRKRLGEEDICAINQLILEHNNVYKTKADSKSKLDHIDNYKDDTPDITPNDDTHNGDMIIDATACPQNIAFPTDLNLLNDARVKSEEIIDFIWKNNSEILQETIKQKPRTYREVARKQYLQTAQKKRKTAREIRKANKKQLAYLTRNIEYIYSFLNLLKKIPLSRIHYKYFLVIQTLRDQQKEMLDERKKTVSHRIVSIHQPHVRPIVRGKQKAKVEFGAKVDISVTNGFVFLEKTSWEAYNEGTTLIDSVVNYIKKTGFYPKRVLVDKIYCNRVNRKKLKQLGIKLVAKALGRPPKKENQKAMEHTHISPGERNPVEGKFGQAKTAYGLNRIKAKLSNTSLSWIATIFMVLNLVKLTKRVLVYILDAIAKIISGVQWVNKLYACHLLRNEMY